MKVKVRRWINARTIYKDWKPNVILCGFMDVLSLKRINLNTLQQERPRFFMV